MKKKWYILKIKNGEEKNIINKIKYKLLKVKKLKYIKYIFIPTKKYIKFKNGKKQICKIKYLPGYMFIYIYLNKYILLILKKITGIYGFLNERYNKLPLNINYNELKNIIKKNYNYKNYNYKIGENVIINSGIFNNIKGRIEKINKNNIILSINFLGKKTEIKLNFDNINKLYK
ncbi:transcription termination/antitermination protein NusG [Candidatus Shikimatogenerans bostrichidophilus]|uniref:transcription termination/antitermination protein NusG n=1 Tax=Candidatus Shikimatogenerans bostrichidophilus TaxID=2943807 RepID=UPI0029665BED